MPEHSLVIAKFHPAATASLWLSPTATLAATYIRTHPFWAIRFSYNNDTDAGGVTHQPDRLCVVSSEPSAIPLPNASFTLGPKLALDTGDLYTGTTCEDTSQLKAKAPIHCTSTALSQPLYLHTVPTIRVLGGTQLPISSVLYALESDSYSRFKEAADENSQRLYSVWVNNKKARLGELLPHHAHTGTGSNATTGWSLLSGPLDPTEIFGEMNNPRAYSFEFIYDRDAVPCDSRASIYDELMLYAQLCKDYRWPMAEKAISWLEALRAWHHGIVEHPYSVPAPAPEPQPHGPDPSGARTPTHAHVQALLRRDTEFRNRFIAATELGKTPYNEEEDSDYESDSDHTSADSDVRYLEFVTLPFACPVVSRCFTTVPLPNRPTIVVLDMFGVILDREGAIRRAIKPWLVFTSPSLDSDDAADHYLEFEALAIREQVASGRATSLAAAAHTALIALADMLLIPIPMHARFVKDALYAILHPPIFDDVEAACLTLREHECVIVALVPFSPSTLAVLRRALPKRLLDHIHFYPVDIPVHTPVPTTFFTPLLEWCNGLPGLRVPAASSDSGSASPPAPRVAAADVLVVSASVGRVIGPATGTFVQPHPTAHLERPHSIEGMVEFYVGEGRNSPNATVTVGGLDELVRVLFDGSDLDLGSESGSGSTCESNSDA
ncbi:hypothetical protein C8Q77DRAFT_1178633 [Trametes polyzona]|nr:hypothetical protein C8Q77DRAFT_1178633 [Trametes polyzona]